VKILNGASSTTTITGFRGVDIEARHTGILDVQRTVWNVAAAIIFPQEGISRGRDELNDVIDADKGALVIAGARAGVSEGDLAVVDTNQSSNPVALYVQAHNGAFSNRKYNQEPSSVFHYERHTSEDIKIVRWDSNVTILGGLAGAPLLMVDGNGKIRAINAVELFDVNGNTVTPAVDSDVPLHNGEIHVAAIVNAGWADILMEADQKIVNADYVAPGSIRGQADYPWPIFEWRDTLPGVTIVNYSPHNLRLSNIDVVNDYEPPGSYPLVELRGGSADWQVNVTLEFDVRHVAGTSYVDIEQRSATAFGLELDGAINNPVGLTRIINLHGPITATGNGLVTTNQLDVDAVEGSLGSSSSRLKVDLITFVLRAYNGGPTPGERVSRLLAHGGTDVFLSLRGLDRRQLTVTELTILIDRAEAGQDLDLELRDTLRQPGTNDAADTYALTNETSGIWSTKRPHDSHFRGPDCCDTDKPDYDPDRTGAVYTKDPALYLSAADDDVLIDGFYKFQLLNLPLTRTNVNFLTTGLQRYQGDLRNGEFVMFQTTAAAAESPGLIAGRHIDVRDSEGLIQGDAAADLNVGPTIRIFGFTNLKDTTPGWLDVNVKGSVELKEVDGDMRVGIVRSRTDDVTVTAKGSIIDASTGETKTSDVDPGDNIDLIALDGSVGTEADFIETNLLDTVHSVGQSGLLDADAELGVYVQEVTGNMRVGLVDADQNDATKTSDAVLAARNGSILDGANDAAADIEAIRVDLYAPLGGIGIFTNDLDIDSSNTGPQTGRLYALADGSVYITETDDELVVLAAKSLAGDVRLTMPDTDDPRGPPNSEAQPEDLILVAEGTSLVSEGEHLSTTPTADPVSGIWAKLDITLLVGDDVYAPVDTLIIAGGAITIRGDHGNADAGAAPAGWGTTMYFAGRVGGVFNLKGADDPTEQTLIFGHTDVDDFTFDGTFLGADTTVYGSDDLSAAEPDGEDRFFVDELQTIDVAAGHTLTLDGQAKSDSYKVQTTGSEGSARHYVINVLDTGVSSDGVDELEILGTESSNDIFLLRRSTSIGKPADRPAFVALLHGELGLLRDTIQSNETSASVQRINYDAAVNGRVSVHGLGGDDFFATDDNSAITTLEGGDGNDFFQIGQIFGTKRDEANGGVAAGDVFPELVATTRGYLSPGISAPLVAVGGAGSDQFNVYSNHAELRLEGGDDNDFFTVRAFAKAATDANGDIVLGGNGLPLPVIGGGFSTARPLDIRTGGGDDEVQYNINAPVSIDGGGGFDKVAVLGTEFPDDIVITANAIYGAGTNVRYSTVEAVEIDGLEGDDEFFVLSTAFGVSYRVIGGLGSDTINVGGDVVEDIVVRELEGASGSVDHLVTSAGDIGYAGLPVPGLDVQVAGVNEGLVVITESSGFTAVQEGGPVSIDSYTVRLSRAPTSTVYVTVSAARPPRNEATTDPKAETVWLCATPTAATCAATADFQRHIVVNGANVDVQQYALVLVFTPANYATAQTVYVFAYDDLRPEGDRVVTVSHSVISADALFHATAVRNVEVTVRDNDTANVVVVQVAPGTSTEDARSIVLEGDGGAGITDDFLVRLAKAPAAGKTVTVLLSPSDSQVTLSHTSISFDEFTWDDPVRVTVTAAPDFRREDPHTTGITFSRSAATTDADYNFADQRIGVRVLDDDMPGLIVTESGMSTVVTVGGPGDDYTIRLTQQPAANVQVAIVTDGLTDVATINGSPVTMVPIATFTGLLSFDSANRRITRTDGGSFLAAGFLEGQRISVDGVGMFKIAIIRGLNATQDDTLELTDEFVAPSLPAGTHTIARLAAVVTFTPADYASPRTIGLVADTHFEIPLVRQGSKTFGGRPHLLGELQGALAVEGGVSDVDRSLQPALKLPGEKDGPLFGVAGQGDEAEQVDVLNVYNDSSRQDWAGTLTSGSLSGFGMVEPLTFGSSPSTIEVLNILLGSGNDRLRIEGTLIQATPAAVHGSITVVHGGGNSPLQVTGQMTLAGITLTRGDGLSWVDDGFAAGQVVSISGIGERMIVAVSGAVLTLAAPVGSGTALVSVAVVDPQTPGTPRIGGDRITVVVGGGPDSPLVIYGDTSQDGVWYSGHPGDVLGGDFGPKPFDVFPAVPDEDERFEFPLADPFDFAGHDVIDASAIALHITAYGGAGDDRIIGSQAGDFLAAGSGDDFVDGQDGIDQIYGDSGVNVDLIRRELSITTANASGAPNADGLVAGKDTLLGDDGDDVIFGDHGRVDQDVLSATVGPAGYTRPLAKPQKIQTTLRIQAIQTREPANGAADTIAGDLGIDRILGGNGADTITGDGGDDLILGDHGLIRYPTPDSGSVHPDLISTSDPNQGAGDSIEGDDGFDIILAGTGGDVVSGNTGNDLLFGDHGKVEGDIDTTLLPLSMPVAAHPFVWTSIDTGAAQGGGDDLIRGNGGDDIVLGGQGADRITGGEDDDDIIGGHNVAGGADAGDWIDAGAGNDWIAGDNADLLRTGSRLSPRFRVLLGDAIFDTAGNAQVTGASQLDPNPANEERVVRLFNHSAGEPAGTFGGDVIAGGAEEDVIFGQLGDDWIQGDGSAIDDAGAVTIDVVATRRSFEDWAGIDRDGRDWVEGGGGADTIFGGLGQDDLIGGSSSLYSLTSPSLRPGGTDTIFGGAGTRLVRNDFGDLEPDGHAHDADVIMGDNANVFRLVGADGAFLTFVYDTYSSGERIIPRAYTFLDYTQGGAPTDIGAADLIHGESGDDTIHGMTGSDVLFGEGQDDDIYGGTGFDRVYGGTGQDGILGDDGKIFTSRNGSTEPLNLLTTPNEEELVELNGPFTGGLVAIAGELKKQVVLAAWTVGAADIIYGGLGDDFLHGGAGDDAVSGAEALREFYDEAPQVDSDPLRYDPATTKFALYDADDPWAKIAGFLLNFDAYRVEEASGQPLEVGGELVKSDDGRDRIFGDNGNDWIVGGTNCDWMFGGFGDDLISLDDNLETNGGRNDRPEDDERYREGDFAFGGAGRDVMIANTGQDRMFDWHGEFNTYVVPFAPFGVPTVNRLFSPDVRELMRELAYAAGADVTLTPSEPFDEIALVEPGDGPLYQDQTGGPRDPQPGNIGGVQRDPVGGKNLHCPCEVTPLIHVSKFLWTTDGALQRVSSASGIGPVLAPGTSIYWTYEVTNLSLTTVQAPNVPLLITRIGDDLGSAADPTDDFAPVFVSGDTNGNGLLDIGETWIYTSRDVVAYSVVAGLYTNTVTVEGRAADGTTTADTAENRHAGSVVAAVAIKKAVNAVDELAPTLAEEADAGTGPVLAVGTTVKWTYRVTNATATPLANIVVSDDNGTPGVPGDDFNPAFVGGDTDVDGLLDPGEVWLYRAFGTVAFGQYANVGSVTATDGTTLVAATDRAHYLGTTGFRIVKLANGDDANAAPGAVLPIGAPVVYTYRVFGESAVSLSGVAVRDDNGTPGVLADDFDALYVSGDANANGLLDFGEIWLFSSQGVAGARSTVPALTTVNVATVTASRGGTPVSASDVAYVTGRPTSLTVIKAINAFDPAHPQPFEDADTAPGRSVVVGSTVTFTFAVSTDGLSPVRDVVVTDSAIASVTPVTGGGGFNVGDADRDNLLDPGEVWIFRATATALAGLHTNTGTATGVDTASGVTLTAADTANYTGDPVFVTVVKAVNAANPANPTAAEDANDWRSPVMVAAGATAVFTYTIARPTADLTTVVVTDDNGTPENPADDFRPTLVDGDNNRNGVLDRNETWVYRATVTVREGLVTNVARVIGVNQGITYSDDDPASVFGWVVAVDVQKATNAADRRDPTAAEDADAAPGVIVAVGRPVVWTYLATNTGNVALTIGLRDDAGTGATGDDFTPRFVDGDTNANGRLDPGETWLYTSAGVVTYTAAVGQYANGVTLTTTAPDGTTVTRRELSFHLGVATPLELVKAVNAANPLAPTQYEDADFAPGAIMFIGDPLTWTYLLRNTGNAVLEVVGIQDDGGVPGGVGFAPDPVEDADGFNVGDADRDGLLGPGEAWLFQRTGLDTVAPGLHTNTATAFATFHGANPVVPVTATDVANVYGTSPGIMITKAVNGEAADTPADAVYLAPTAIVTWTYIVTSTALGAIADVVVSDDAGTPGVIGDDFRPTFTGGDTNGDGLLDPDEAWMYEATGVIGRGLYANVATADGVQGGVAVRDVDTAYAFGADPRITVAKALNALNPLAPTPLEDANSGLTKELFVSGTAVFTYLVRNTGNIRVGMDKVSGIVDDHATPAAAGDDFRAVYVSGDLNDDGWLDLGETWLFRAATLVVQAGSYTNTATATATEPRTGQTATAADTARYFGRTGAEGHTPGFWKTNVDTKNAVAWPRTPGGELVLDPLQPVSSVFSGFPPEMANLSLVDGLGLGGGGLEALLRHATAGLLNALHPWVTYPLSAPEVIALTNAAVASGDAVTIESLKSRFQGYNELGSDLDANGRVPPPTLSVGGVSVAEGQSGSSSVLVTVSLSSPAINAVSVNWATANGTATAGSDYTAASGSVSFALGDSVKTVSVTILGDGLVEPNETFTVRLTNPVGAAISTGTATVTITNDDAQPVVTVTASDAAGAEAANDPITFVVTRSANLTGAITVTLQWSGAALLGSDFTVSATGGTLTNGTRLALADGASSATLTVRPIDDAAVEPAESVVLTVASGTGYTPGTPAQASGSITDNDGALQAASAPPAGTDPGAPLTQEQLDAALAAAEAQWRAVRADADFTGVTAAAADLPGLLLGRTEGRAITIDSTAAGWSWEAMDLPTVLVHELGHVLRLEHAEEGVMRETLAPRTIRGPPGSAISLSVDGDELVIAVGGVESRRPLASAAGLTIEGSDEDETFAIVTAVPVAVTLAAGGGSDRLAGPAADAIWSITGAGAGSVAGVAFSGFEHLAGAAGNADTFVFGPAGTLGGILDGGDGGYDSLVLAGGTLASIVSTITGPRSGTVARDGGVIRYEGLEPIEVGAGTTSFTINASGGADVITLRDRSEANQFEVICSCGESHVFVDAAALTPASRSSRATAPTRSSSARWIRSSTAPSSSTAGSATTRSRSMRSRAAAPGTSTAARAATR
jgi:Ca2+-binding RTX toxin-like protein